MDGAQMNDLAAEFGDQRLPQRFWAQVELIPFSTCWHWVGVHWRGYGRFKTHPKNTSAHRYAYENLVGPIPAGLQLDHFRCDQRGCVNPAHLRAVTNRENALRGNTVTSKNRAKMYCPRGHPLTGENLVACWLRRGSRGCRTCHLDRCQRTNKANGAW